MGSRSGTRRAERRRYGTDRAGTSGRRFARQRLAAFVRSRWQVLALMLVVLLAFAPLLWLALDPVSAIRDFALGAYIAGVIAATYHWAVLASGAGLASMGEEAEIWTDQELTRLPSTWQVINHVVFRQGDIDHVAIGPDGVIVVETKWTSSSVHLDGTDGWLGGALRQAERNADDVAMVLGWGADRDSRPVHPFVVVWGPQVEPATVEPHRNRAGVSLIAGRHLRSVLEGFDGEVRLDEAEQQRCYHIIRDHVDRRDASDISLYGRVRAPWYQTLARTAEWLFLGFGGFFVSAEALKLPLAAFIVLQALALVAGVAAVRTERWRTHGMAWLIGTQAVTLLLLIDVLASTFSGRR